MFLPETKPKERLGDEGYYARCQYPRCAQIAVFYMVYKGSSLCVVHENCNLKKAQDEFRAEQEAALDAQLKRVQELDEQYANSSANSSTLRKCSNLPRINKEPERSVSDAQQNYCSKCGQPLRMCSKTCQKCGMKNRNSKNKNDLTKYSLRLRVRKFLRKGHNADTLFDRIDADGSGQIDAAELQHALGEMGCGVDDEDVEYLLELMDTDGDGQISLDEFKSFIGSSCDDESQYRRPKHGLKPERRKIRDMSARAARKFEPKEEAHKKAERKQRRSKRGEGLYANVSAILPSIGSVQRKRKKTRRRHQDVNTEG
jgi:hypothetical protein